VRTAQSPGMHAPAHLLSLAGTLCLGAAIGVLGGLFGIGGGLFGIPLLGLLYGYDQQHAQGTSLVMSVPNLLVALWNYARRGNMNPRIAAALAIGGTPCTFVGALIATRVASSPLRHAFGAFVIGIAAYMLLQARRRAQPMRTGPPAGWPAAVGIGALGGSLSGIFSVGGAVAAVPMIGALFKVGQATAQGFGLALVAPGSLANIAAYGFAGDIEWSVGLVLALGGIVAVPAGVSLAHRLPDRTLRVAFGLLLAVAGGALLAHA